MFSKTNVGEKMSSERQSFTLVCVQRNLSKKTIEKADSWKDVETMSSERHSAWYLFNNRVMLNRTNTLYQYQTLVASGMGYMLPLFAMKKIISHFGQETLLSSNCWMHDICLDVGILLQCSVLFQCTMSCLYCSMPPYFKCHGGLTKQLVLESGRLLRSCQCNVLSYDNNKPKDSQGIN